MDTQNAGIQQSWSICKMFLVLLVSCFAMMTVGCGSPSAANIALRKQNQGLQLQVDQLMDRHRRDAEALSACQRAHPTTATLSPSELDQVVTTHGLKIGNLTGGDNPDSTQDFDNQLKVYAVPLDDESTPIKAAGSFKVEAFDLDDPQKPLIGTWTFDRNQSAGMFFSQILLYTYVLSCPWQTMPVHPDLTLRITFDDQLTGREFVQQVQAKVRPPRH